MLKYLLLVSILCTPCSLAALEVDKERVIYDYHDRQHETSEIVHDAGWVYLLTWILYPLTQHKNFTKEGSFSRYRSNLGHFVFDNDEPKWNWGIHPLVGSQFFLYYRAKGYSRPNAMGMLFISSTLFETTVEVYQEPASIQDLYQTPVYGSLLGVALEYTSLYLLNTGNPVAKVVGHILNPSTLFDFYEGKIVISPSITSKNSGGIWFCADF